MILAATIAGLALLAGCTMRPQAARLHQPSFSETGQDSGFVGFDGAGNAVITSRARARYNALIGLYGAKFPVPVMADYGITPDGMTNSVQLYILTPDGLVKFRQMNIWRVNKAPGGAER